MTEIFRKRGFANRVPRKAEFIAAVHQVMEKARQLYPEFNIQNHEVPIVFYHKGVARGKCKWGNYDGYRYDFNLEFSTHTMETGWEGMIKEVIPHEVAHMVNVDINDKNGHGSEWKRICIALGGDGKRCHSEDMSAVKRNRHKDNRVFVYRASCGTEIPLKKIRHNKLQSGKALYYTLSRTGGKITAQDFIRISY